jgi:hypothetical protein
MTPRLAVAALEFLKRVELRGVECYVLHDVMMGLERDAKAQPEGEPEDRPMRVVGGVA